MNWFPRILTVFLAATILTSPSVAGERDIRTRLEALASLHGFSLTGAEHLEGPGGIEREGTLHQRLVNLLRDHQYIIQVDESGRVRHVDIVGAHLDRSGETARRSISGGGSGRFAQSFVVGPNGTQRLITFEFDRSLSTTVLPRSMMGVLGYKDSNTQPVTMNWQNERIEARMGLLASMTVDGREIRNVAVGFIAGERLGGRNLIGAPMIRRLGIKPDED